jgi:hypothetical protein
MNMSRTVKVEGKVRQLLLDLVVAKMRLETELGADCDSVTGQLAAVHSAFAEQGIDLVYDGPKKDAAWDDDELALLTGDIWTKIKAYGVIHRP